jgi:hypothetical protein
MIHLSYREKLLEVMVANSHGNVNIVPLITLVSKENHASLYGYHNTGMECHVSFVLKEEA